MQSDCQQAWPETWQEGERRTSCFQLWPAELATAQEATAWVDFAAVNCSGPWLLFFLLLTLSQLTKQVDAEEDLSACVIKGLVRRKAEASIKAESRGCSGPSFFLAPVSFPVAMACYKVDWCWEVCVPSSALGTTLATCFHELPPVRFSTCICLDLPLLCRGPVDMAQLLSLT